MNILHIPKLFASSHEGWDDIERIHPTILKLFFLLVVPFSLVPPLMLELAGHSYGRVMFPGTSSQAWSHAALIFLAAELLTVPLMAWGIKFVVNYRALSCNYHDAFALASIAAVPLWLSSLSLLTGNRLAIVSLAALGLLGSVVLIFRGVAGILKLEEEGVAVEVAYRVTALGLLAWALLLALALIPAFA